MFQRVCWCISVHQFHMPVPIRYSGIRRKLLYVERIILANYLDVNDTTFLFTKEIFCFSEVVDLNKFTLFTGCYSNGTGGFSTDRCFNLIFFVLCILLVFAMFELFFAGKIIRLFASEYLCNPFIFLASISKQNKTAPTPQKNLEQRVV